MIVYSSLTVEEISTSPDIRALLSLEEIALLLLHISKPTGNKLMLKIETPRTASAFGSVFSICKSSSWHEEQLDRPVYWSVNQKVKIFGICTTFSAQSPRVGVLVRNSLNQVRGLKVEKYFDNGFWSFKFEPSLQAEPNTEYSFLFTNSILADGDHASEQTSLEQGSVTFTISAQLIYHYLMRIDYCK